MENPIRKIEEIKHTIVDESRSNSLEFGPANRRHKIYYKDASELIQKIKDLKEIEKLLDENND